MRKSKYDLFILYDPKENELTELIWDSAENGISQWRHWGNEGTCVVKSNSYLSKALRKYVIIDRIPEHIHRGY